MDLHPCEMRPGRPLGQTRVLLLPLVALLLPGPFACGGQPESPNAPAAAAAVEPKPISGTYDVQGVTTAIGGAEGEGRRIDGTVILKRDGDDYSATFNLDTTFPGLDAPVQADVIGNGEGKISGRTLTGSTSTQLVIATIPGIDTDFAFIPRIVGARIVSTSLAEIAPDGSIEIELQNRPAEGEDYRPTRTRLTGVRVSDSRTARSDVSAPLPGR